MAKKIKTASEISEEIEKKYGIEIFEMKYVMVKHGLNVEMKKNYKGGFKKWAKEFWQKTNKGK